MPQDSVPYAVARIHVLERDALDAARIDRLLSAPGYDDALRALTEFGWNVEGGNAEAVAAARVRRACELVRRVTPCEDATDCFLLRYDAMNLKTLLKARCLGQEAAYLSDCGVYPVELLRHAVADHSYKKLPDVLREALDGLEKALAVREDALRIDVTVDRAVYRLIDEKMRAVDSPALRAFFAARADLSVAVTLLRALRMGRDRAFFASVLLPGGTITEKAWLTAYDKPESLPALLAGYGRRVQNAAAAAVQDADRLPALEKAADDAATALLSPFKRDALRLEPVAGYLLGAEREAAAVRLILSGKRNGFPLEAIRERLRDAYGA